MSHLDSFRDPLTQRLGKPKGIFITADNLSLPDRSCNNLEGSARIPDSATVCINRPAGRGCSGQRVIRCEPFSRSQLEPNTSGCLGSATVLTIGTHARKYTKLPNHQVQPICAVYWPSGWDFRNTPRASRLRACERRKTNCHRHNQGHCPQVLSSASRCRAVRTRVGTSLKSILPTSRAGSGTRPAQRRHTNDQATV